jgi:hypothetical protein
MVDPSYKRTPYMMKKLVRNLCHIPTLIGWPTHTHRKTVCEQDCQSRTEQRGLCLLLDRWTYENHVWAKVPKSNPGPFVRIVSQSLPKSVLYCTHVVVYVVEYSTGVEHGKSNFLHP